MTDLSDILALFTDNLEKIGIKAMPAVLASLRTDSSLLTIKKVLS